MKIIQPIGTIAGTAISRIAITLAEEFARQGHDSTLVIWNRDKLDRDIDPRVKIIETSIVGVSRRNLWTKLLRGVFKPLLGAQLFLVFFAPLISRQLQKKVLDKGDYDVAILHAHSVFGLRYIKTPYVIVSHSIKSKQLLNSKRGWVNRFRKKIYRRVYKEKQIITVSEGIRQDFAQNFDLDISRMRRIFNPLDITYIRSMGEESVGQDIPHRPFVIAVGRNDPSKRFDRLLHCFAKSEIAQDLVILGRANESESLKRQVNELDLSERVHFLGFKKNPYPYIKAADCLLVTSDYEGFGMVLVEALALGVPVVSTDCPSGPSEILGEGLSNCLVPLGNDQLLASKIWEITRTPPAIEKSYVERFSLEVVGVKYLEVLAMIGGKL